MNNRHFLTLIASMLLSGALQAQDFTPAAPPEGPAAAPNTSAGLARGAVVTSADAAYRVQTGARSILPDGDIQVLKDTNEKVFLQFERPLRAEERADLQAAGVVFYETLAPFTYLASAPAATAGVLSRHALFRGVAPIAAPDKLTTGLYTGQVPAHARRAKNETAAFVRFYRDVSLEQALLVLDGAGVEVRDRGQLLAGNRLEVTSSTSQIRSAADSPLVRSIGEVPPPAVIFNQQSATVANVPLVNVSPYFLTGSGVEVGIWDGGAVRDTHQDLTGRVIIQQNTKFCSKTSDPRTATNTTCFSDSDCPGVTVCNEFSDHATHVAGTIMSSGTNKAIDKGMAPGITKLFSYNFQGGSPVTEMHNAVRDDLIAPLLSNHSWGYGVGWPDSSSQTGFGLYEGTSSAWDALVRDTDHIIVKASGNDGNDCNPSNSSQCDGFLGSPSDSFRYDTISYNGIAKNVITVGSIKDDGVTKSSFSSTGPANDGRVKPDIVADGDHFVDSTCAQSNSDYCGKGGTSMATPVVSGVAALLTERWQDFHSDSSSGKKPNNPYPELMKALLANTATDLGRPGPDYAYGHGSVNALEAVQQLSLPNTGTGTSVPNQHRMAFVDEGQTIEFTMPVSAGDSLPMQVAIAWTDLAGSSAATPQYCRWLDTKIQCTSDADCGATTCGAPACGAGQACDLKNDLNVWITRPAPDNSTAAQPWIPPGLANVTANATVFPEINHVDNVEVMRWPHPGTPGDYRVRVRGFTVNEGPQRFAITANRQLIFVNPYDDFASAKTLPALIPADPSEDYCVSGESPCPATLYPHNQWHAVNFDADTETGEPTTGSSSRQASVWFNFTPSATGVAVFDTFGADFDTTLGAYTGSSVDNLTLAAGTQAQDDDDSGTRQSKITFDVAAGSTYRIAVAGFLSHGRGVFPLNYHVTPPPAVCGNSIIEAGETCDDGNTADGDCCSSSCVYDPALTACDNGNACTVNDQCDGAGVCNDGSFAAAGTACNDGSICTDTDVCTLGVCAGAPISCNDGIVCTDDACDPSDGCINTPNTGNSCEDGDACTTGDLCASGVCVGGGPLDCNDNNECTDDSCNPVVGCVADNNTNPCEDGAFCTTGDVCSGGSCSAGGPLDCNDSNVCTSGDYCDESLDSCVNDPVTTLNLANQTIDTSQDFAAIDAITAGNAVVINAPGIVTFDAPLIVLGSDFSVTPGAEFIAANTGICEGGPTCAHPICETGVALEPTCDDCVAQICAADPFCCNNNWDATCVNEVTSICGLSCGP